MPAPKSGDEASEADGEDGEAVSPEEALEMLPSEDEFEAEFGD